MTGRAVRVDLDRDRTLVAALWCDDGRTAATAGGFSWLSDAYLVDERQRAVCSGREPVALAATVCALQECGALPQQRQRGPAGQIDGWYASNAAGKYSRSAARSRSMWRVRSQMSL